MHYSQIQSSIKSTYVASAGVEPKRLQIHLEGFVDVYELGDRLEQLFECPEVAPAGVLCDLRAVAGYGPGTPTLARKWLELAHRVGVRRVALVANSSVLRTAARVISGHSPVLLRCFASERDAQLWLAAG